MFMISDMKVMRTVDGSFVKMVYLIGQNYINIIKETVLGVFFLSVFNIY